jgi:hypothetical protein
MPIKNMQLIDITVIFLLFLLSLSAGCAPLNLVPLEEPTENSRKIEAAERLFINGKFQQALVEYEQLYLQSLTPMEKDHVLYGLACTRLMLAENDEELILAIDDLQQWDIKKGRARFSENRHLLVMGLQQQAALIRERNKILAENEMRKDTLIDERNKSIAAQDRKISQLNSQLEKLQTQLLELEKIEENVQEKRQP